MAEQYIAPYEINQIPSTVPVDICGLSARFPESSSGSEFMRNLLSGKDMITSDERKWKHIMHPDMPKRGGRMKKNELYSFDAQFFGVHGQQAKKMDPQLMKLLEVAYEAWMDTGIDVRSLRDSNRVGVYTGICGSEVHGWYTSQKHLITGYEQTGCVMSMTANRLSYFFSFRGPSKTCDTACSSAAMSLHDAVADISAGRTDYAVVLGSCHTQAPNMTLAFNRLHMLSPEGACKAFDAAGNGYVRSEGIAAVVLQRSGMTDVPRWAAVTPYCTIKNIGINNDGFTKEGITFPSKNAQFALEQQVCQMAKINPADVVYVEAHGTGTVAGDGQEMDAIDRWYGRAEGRDAPLLIGSVKSNMGHCEGCSAIAGVIKCCLAMEYGMMPGNLWFHKDTPNPDSLGLKDGTLEVCDSTRPFDGGLIALSSFGFGGANMHMVMEGRGGSRINLVQTDSSSSSSDSASEDGAVEVVTPLAARTSEGLAYLAKIINETEQAEGTSFSEPLRRYANAVATDVKLCHRGTLTNGELKAGAPVNKTPEIWFVFSGNGSQWPKMGATLLTNNTTFLKSVSACAAVLKPLGIDLLAEFQAERGWKTPVLASVGLIAVQIGLVDILREEYGVVPDGMMGHSAGEIGCTYASGCCTKEQAMLIAYHRGRLPIEHKITTGLMAATGLSAAEARERVQGTNVVMACDNSPSSTTISGPAEEVRALVKQLDSENIFARALETNGVPYHSPVLDPLLKELDECLKQVMPNPVKRPAGWVSAAFEADSELPDASLCSAGYQVHSYRNPVLFTGAAAQVPKDALLVEIGPHSILRSPLRQNRPDLGYVNVMRKGEDGQQSLATAIGDMWRKGVPVQWKADAVPSNEVGTEVPRSIREALTSWDRMLYDIPVITFPPGPGKYYKKQYDLGGDDNYITEHCIDGVVFLPLSSFLVTAWEGRALWDEKPISEFPVEFLDVEVFQPVRAEKTEKVVLEVCYNFSNKFQVVHDDEVICTGTIKPYDLDRLEKEQFPYPDCKQKPKPPKELTGVDPAQFDHMTGEHWYSFCLRQNLQYGPKFRMVTKYAVDRTWADLRWTGSDNPIQNWIIHLDGIFQTTDRHGDYHVHVAKGMRRLVVNDTLTDQVDAGYVETLDTDTNWKLTRSRSFILQNYLDEIAPSKHKAAKTLVHKLGWAPYGDRVLDNQAKTGYTAKLTSHVKHLLAGVQDSDSQLLKVKAIFDKLPAKALSPAEVEALTGTESNRLAAIFMQVLGSEDGPSTWMNAISDHSGLGQAFEEDPFLSQSTQAELEGILGIAVSNMKSAGYTVGEAGATNTAFTKKALETFITVPQSSLRSYTATDSAATSDVTKAIPYSSLEYKSWDVNGKKPSPGPFNILVANNLSSTAKNLPAALASLYDSVLEGGFIMLEELTGPLGAAVYGFDEGAWNYNDGRKFGPLTSVEHWKQLLSGAGFTEVSVVRRPQDVSAVFLYRKVPAVPSKAVVLEAPIVGASEKMMDEWLPAYLRALDQVDADTEDGEPGTVWLYGDSVNHSGMLGFVTSARKEYKGDRVRAVVSAQPGADFTKLVQDARHSDLIINYYNNSRNGFYAPVQTKYKYLKDEAECKHGAHLNFEVYGNLRSSIWRENVPTPDGIKGIIKCNVAFGALNFRDVMLAYGKLSKQQMAHESGGDNIGFEFSGYIEGTKTRVMGSAKNAIATKVVTRDNLIWEIPDSWSMAEAATVPTAYMTAYYSMVMRGRVKKGMRVLIHSGTGAVGMAAIQICLTRGAEVFTTVGSAPKRKFLLDAFGAMGLRDDHIGNSRSESFEGLVRNATKGKGVHLLLNSLSDEKLQASVRCLGNWGKLLEIGKYDILQGTPLSMRPMLNNIAFEGIDVDRVMNHPESTELPELNALVAAGLKSGEVRPLPITVFKRDEIEEAFRYLAGGTHIGKVMIDTTANPVPQHSNNALGPKATPAPANGSRVPSLPALKMEPNIHFDPSKSYIVTGGLGGFGQAVFEFLSAYGARNIVITSKRGVRNGNQQIALQALYTQGINFRVTTLDVGVPEEAEQIVNLAESMAPVGGVFHLAMYLADKLVTNQNGESWAKVMHAKAKGGFNMDKATRRCKSLDHFVMWSSFVASAGNEGQTNYGYANACLDALSEKRKSEGLPSLSIQWGVIDHVGVADAAIQELMAAGLLGASMAQPIDDCLIVLGRLMFAGPLQSAVMTSSWQPTDLLGKSGGGEAKNVLQSILQVMGLTVAEVNDADTLSRLGIDSMQLVEARSNLQRALGRPVALDEASGMSIGDIKALEGSDGDDAAAGGDASGDAPAQEAQPKGKTVAPLIHPAKLIDLQKDLPVKLPKEREVIRAEAPMIKSSKPNGMKGTKSATSLQPPATPERQQSDLLRPSRFSGDSVGSAIQERSVSPSPEMVVSKPKALPAVAKPPAARKLVADTVSRPSSPAAAGAAPLNSNWEAMASQGFFALFLALFFVVIYTFQAAGNIANHYGLLPALLLLPVLYMLAGLAMVAMSLGLKTALTSRVKLDTPIRMFSKEFYEWWITARFADVTNVLFMRNFRGTVVYNYYLTFLGAKIGDGAFIDTTDIMDPECLEVGKNAVIGEGATVLGHTFKDGHIIFSKVVIGEEAQVYPFAVVTPNIQVKDGQELTPLAKASQPLSLTEARGLAAALSNVIPTSELSEYQTLGAQMGALTVTLLVASVAAFVGCATYQGVMARLGFHLEVSSAAYTTTALVAMTNPLLAIFGAMMLPAHAVTLSGIFNLVPATLATFVAMPLAWGAYALTLVALASFAKHFLTGRIEAGVHKRNSSYGVAFWASQRLMELTYANVSGVMMGTWALNAIYRTFGASIGGYTSFRKVPAVNVPDMLKMGNLVVAGDTCKIASSIAVDSSSIVCAPIKIGTQGTLGASCVVLPGLTVGSQATLAPLAVPELGSTVDAKTVVIGAPARPVKLDKRPEPVIDVQLPMHVLAQALPFLQAFGIVSVALISHLPSVAVGLYVRSYNPGVLGSLVGCYLAICIQCQLVGRVNCYLQERLSIANPAVPARQWRLPYLVSSGVTAMSIYCANFGDALFRSSPSWIDSLRRAGVEVGENCYIDAEWAGEPGMAKYGDGAIADRGSIVFGHLMTHNGECFNVHFNHVSIAPGAQVAARSGIFPGVNLKAGEIVPSGEMRMAL